MCFDHLIPFLVVKVGPARNLQLSLVYSQQLTEREM